MDCLKFSHWLENRDLYDVSEADIAVKHAETCKECQAKLKVDEQLDKFIANALTKEAMPDSLPGQVSMSIDRISARRSKTGYRLFGMLSAAVAVMVVFALTMSFSPTIPTIDDMARYVIDDHNYHGDSVLQVDRIEDLPSLGGLAASPQEIMAELPKGLSFVGARYCPLGECEAIHMVFRQNEKRLSIYLIKAADVDFSLSPERRYSLEEGRHIVSYWKKGKYIYAMVG